MRILHSILLAGVSAMAFAAMAVPPQAAPAPSLATATATATADVRYAADLVRDAIGDRRLVLLGEVHGTQEAPALAGALLDHYVARHHPLMLALEMGTQEQPRFDRYLASRGTPADRAALLAGEHWQDQHHDGRDSKAMFDLIEHARHLRSHGAAIGLVAFDDADIDMDTRNRRMAETLRRAAMHEPAAVMVVLTGNVHAMTRRPPWEMLDDGKRIEPPMTAGRYLADLHPLSINVRGASGAFWACADGGRCAVQPVTTTVSGSRGTGAHLERNAADDAWDETLLLPRFTPSPPAISPHAHAGPARARKAPEISRVAA